MFIEEVALETVASLRGIIASVKAQDANLADQIRRAASSVVLNIAEAAYNSAGHRRNRLQTALGSANETRVGIRLAVALGYIEADAATMPLQQLDRVIAMAWKWSRRA